MGPYEKLSKTMADANARNKARKGTPEDEEDEEELEDGVIRVGGKTERVARSMLGEGKVTSRKTAGQGAPLVKDVNRMKSNMKAPDYAARNAANKMKDKAYAAKLAAERDRHNRKEAGIALAERMAEKLGIRQDMIEAYKKKARKGG